ncbi:hypothetical protein GCM10010145_33050 [Streptomyces ruber]|uniref:Uncharacterized protein n=2 Tax=Streptomyces TaxID=1883 RepID=A0A918BDB7_9ACTN|nr:hypothetical protein [Streptomyces ruber]GGQ60339.1 hypothetical protein GCM10010145_33050 [Streptomyces ruber]
MTAHTTERPVEGRPETGWALARQLRGASVRTCVPALDTEDTAPSAPQTGPEAHIVRGED